MKKLLLICEIEPGGGWIATLRLAEKLKLEQKLQMDLIGLTSQTNYVNHSFQTIKLINYSIASPPFSFLKKIIKDFFMIRKTLYNLDAHDTQTIYCNHYLMLLCLISLNKIDKSNLNYAYHGQKSKIIKTIKDINYREIIIKTLERLALLLSPNIITPSEYGKLMIKKTLGLFYYLKNIKVIPNPLPQIFYEKTTKLKLFNLRKKLKISLQHKIILYVGRIAEYKGLENLILSLPYVIKQINDLVLIIAYPAINVDKKLYDRMQKIIKELEIKNQIRFKPNLAQMQIRDLYHLANATILPSELEISSMVLHESLACATPVITTKTGDAVNLVNTNLNSVLLNSNEPEEIAEKIILFYKDQITS